MSADRSAAHTSPLDGQECYCPVIGGTGTICGAKVESAAPSAAQRRLTVRYTRWQDRVLAFLWPPKRRRLRMQQSFLDAGMDEIRRTADPIQRDLLLYGTAFIGPDGQRIDPRKVRVYGD